MAMLIPSGMEEQACQGCAFPLPAALQLRGTHGFTLYQRFTRGSWTVKGREAGCIARVPAAEESSARKEARTGWAVKGLLACKRRALEGTSLACDSRLGGRPAGEGDARAVSPGRDVDACSGGSTRAKGRYGECRKSRMDKRIRGRVRWDQHYRGRGSGRRMKMDVVFAAAAMHSCKDLSRGMPTPQSHATGPGYM